MPTPSFSKDITTIFNDNEIKEELKYDIACRLICETLQVCSTSMLLYDANEDKLVCKGHYLAPINKSDYKTRSEDLKLIINNIVFLEFLESTPYEDLDNVTVDGFKKSAICGKTFQHYDIEERLFKKIIKKWHLVTFIDKYVKYKRSLHSEKYEISDDSLSGIFFKELLSSDSLLTDLVKFADFESAPQRGKPYFDIWEQQGIHLPKDNLNYIGLPLYANERYIGILRLTVDKNSLFSTNPKKRTSKKVTKSIERLNNFAQLVSLHLKTDYYLAGYQTLSNLSLDFSEKMKVDPVKLQNTCDILTSLINCHGCIIRFNDDKQSQTPPIRATSTSLKNYHEYINSLPHSKAVFSEDIYRAFASNKYIKAINFRIRDFNSDKFETKEFWYGLDNRLRIDTTRQRKFYDYTPELNQKLIGFKMVELLVVALDNIEDGVIVMTNTSNRKFTLSDVEIMLLATKRLQLEIKSRQEIEHQKQNELQNAQIIGMNVVIHQFGQTIKSSSDVVNEIEERNNAALSLTYPNDKSLPINISKMNFCIRLLGFLVMKSQSQIRMAERIMKIEVEPIKPIISPIYDFQKYLRDKCKDFAPYASEEREIHIWMTQQHKDYFRIDTDQELLNEIMNSLLDNAVKYSYEASEMKSRGIQFDKSDYKSDGHIKVEYFQTLSEIEVSITNWGYPILPNEVDSIFERSKRGTNAKKNVVGTGIGLYLAKKFIDALNGNIRVETHRSKTTFILTLKK